MYITALHTSPVPLRQVSAMRSPNSDKMHKTFPRAASPQHPHFDSRCPLSC